MHLSWDMIITFCTRFTVGVTILADTIKFSLLVCLILEDAYFSSSVLRSTAHTRR